MKILIGLFISLILGSSIYADYFILFTQVHVQSELGRIEISRGLSRDQKYVDWMAEHREELAAKNIFVDADFSSKTSHTVAFEMDKQKFEIKISSFRTRKHGPGTAVADNYVEIKVDGALVLESTIGSYRGFQDIQSIEIQPIDHLMTVIGNKYHSCPSDECGYHQEAINKHVFYDDLKFGECFDDNWIFENRKASNERRQQTLEREAKQKRSPQNE